MQTRYRARKQRIEQVHDRLLQNDLDSVQLVLEYTELGSGAAIAATCRLWQLAWSDCVRQAIDRTPSRLLFPLRLHTFPLRALGSEFRTRIHECRVWMHSYATMMTRVRTRALQMLRSDAQGTGIPSLLALSVVEMAFRVWKPRSESTSTLIPPKLLQYITNLRCWFVRSVQKNHFRMPPPPGWMRHTIEQSWLAPCFGS